MCKKKKKTFYKFANYEQYQKLSAVQLSVKLHAIKCTKYKLFCKLIVQSTYTYRS